MKRRQSGLQGWSLDRMLSNVSAMRNRFSSKPKGECSSRRLLQNSNTLLRFRVRRERIWG